MWNLSFFKGNHLGEGKTLESRAELSTIFNTDQHVLGRETVGQDGLASIVLADGDVIAHLLHPVRLAQQPLHSSSRPRQRPRTEPPVLCGHP